MYCKKRTKEFNENIELVKENKNYTITFFSYQSIFVLLLAFVTWNYYHREFRKQALDIVTFLSGKRRLWASINCWKGMQWLINVEEDDLENEEYLKR